MKSLSDVLAVIQTFYAFGQTTFVMNDQGGGYIEVMNFRTRQRLKVVQFESLVELGKWLEKTSPLKAGIGNE
jgi:hypothetical protein